jgi:ABC-type spermidine/putrescine transport system, permease component II
MTVNSWLSPRRFSLVSITALIVVFLLFPVIVIWPLAFTSSNTLDFPPPGFSLQWFENILSDSIWSSSVIASVEVAVGTMVVAILLGFPLTLGLVRGRFRGRGILYGLVLAPLVVPSVVVAVGMFFVWSVGWNVGFMSIGGHLTGTLPGMILAHTTLAMPFVVVLIGASVRGVDPDLELAARGLGADSWHTFRQVTLPLIVPGVLGAGVLAFLVSWDEPVIAQFLGSPTLLTLPARMYTAAKESIDPTVAAISTVVTLTTAVLFALGLVFRRPR